MYNFNTFLSVLVMVTLSIHADGQSPESSQRPVTVAEKQTEPQKNSKLKAVRVDQYPDQVYFNVSYARDKQGSLFLLQRSSDNENFHIVDSRKGAPVTIGDPILYSLQDPAPVQHRKSYYRLLRVDANGMEVLARYQSTPDTPGALVVHNQR